MIPNIGKLAVEQSKMDWQQKEKDLWNEKRTIAYNYYKGRTEAYTSKYFADTLLDKIPSSNVNMTRRIINRISLVYMQPPIRHYSIEDIPNLFHDKDNKLQRLERLTNLLEVMLIKPTWRNEQIEYDLIRDWEPLFANDDPLTPIAITYPISTKDTVMDTTPELMAYWDEDNHFIYDKNGKMYKDEENPDMLNPYHVLPFIEVYAEGKPEASYFDTDASPSLISTNLALNVAETNKNANIMFQSFGYPYITGSNLEKDKIEVGQDKITFLGHDGQFNIAVPPNSIPAITESVNESYKMLALNYHLTAAFVEGTTAASGISIRLRNQELMDARRGDVIKYNELEHKLFALESIIIDTHLKRDAGELINVNYEESTEILTDQEQRDKWDWEMAIGKKDLADVLMESDPDMFTDRGEALAYIKERKTDAAAVELSSNGNGNGSLLAALTAPVS